MVIKANKVRLIDSLNFLTMKLSDFTQAFELGELKKGTFLQRKDNPKYSGHFPHLFSTPENLDYEGPLPDVSYYLTNSLTDGEKETIRVWHKQQVI